ncbi:MAG: hypothetical protein IJP09_00105 [Clostridia bacterium]|nr:hypothetical protein [Clostridia bacterium]
MKKLKSLFILAISSLLILSACNSNIPSENPEEPNTPDLPVEDNVEKNTLNVQNYDDRENKTFFSNTYAIKDGKVLILSNKISQYDTIKANADKIDDAVYLYAERFVRCSNGNVEDLWETDYRTLTYPTADILEQLNNSCGIKKVVWDTSYDNYPMMVYIYANDGTLYRIDEEPDSSKAQNYPSYEEFIKTHGQTQKKDRLELLTYETDPEVKETFSSYMDGKLYSVILKGDGTVFCEYYPEVSEWENIVDIDVCREMVLALTSDGKILSVGTDFIAENVVMVDIADEYATTNFITIALTSDGKLRFGDYPGKGMDLESSDIDSFEKKYYQEIDSMIKQAESFTDVVDFYASSDSWNILVQKSDGSLWATYNDYYDPEYVNILGKEDFLGNE